MADRVADHDERVAINDEGVLVQLLELGFDVSTAFDESNYIPWGSGRLEGLHRPVNQFIQQATAAGMTVI